LGEMPRAALVLAAREEFRMESLSVSQPRA